MMVTPSRLLLAFLCGLFAHVAHAAAVSRSCESVVRVETAAGYSIFVPPMANALRKMEPEFFGFNLEWVGFQNSFWDAESRRVSPDVVEHLKSFPGAVYRYPGGGAANRFHWGDTVGEHEYRPKRKVADWLEPVTAGFGFDEYLSFVRSVYGQPWVVLNLYGTRGGEIEPEALLDSAKAWIEYAKAKELAGADSVMRWELGNELDRGGKSWPPDKYVRIASIFGLAINAAHPTTKAVAMLQDWKAQTFHTTSGYNRRVMAGLRGITAEYAHHIYFDAPPPSREIPHRFSLVCETLSNANKAGVANLRIWITEYGRNIPHAYDNSPEWKRSWPKTANLEAALGVADALILATQIPEIAGMFVHSLATTKGPWPMFHADLSGRLHASVVLHALRLLREGVLPVVLETHVRSANRSGYAGGYDLRAAVMSNVQRDRYAVWAINRSPNAIKVELTIPGLASRALEARHRYLSAASLEANNYAAADEVSVMEAKPYFAFDKKGTTRIELPPHSVSSIGFAR